MVASGFRQRIELGVSLVFQQINTTDQEFQLLQGNIQKALQPLESIPMVGGVLLTGISLTTAVDNFIQHGLGRTPTVFFIGNINASATVWSPVSATLNGASSNRFVLNLRCSANCTVSIWVN